MSYKKISLKQETYELLSKEKFPDESFSDTIERLMKRRGKLMDAVDSWGDIDEEEVNKVEKNIEKARKKLTNEKSLLKIAGIWEDEELRNKVKDTRKTTEKRL